MTGTDEPLPALEELGQRILAFLDRVCREHEDFDRDRQSAGEIRRDLLAILPVDDAGWERGLARIARVVADGFAERVGDWGRVFSSLNRYFGTADVSDDGEHPRRKPNGDIELGLDAFFVNAIIKGASAAERAIFWEQSEFILLAAERLFPGIELDADELVPVLQRVQKEVGGAVKGRAK